MKLLLALDASRGSQTALDEVTARSWPAGSTAEVVSVVEPAHLWTMSITSEEASRRAKDLVERAAGQLSAAGVTAVGVTVVGDPKTVILDRAEKLDADLAIVGSHGVSAVTRFLLGNVAASVARHAPCSVEIVRAPGGHPARKLLLAADGSAYSKAAAASIASRPWPDGVEIRVLSVVEFYLPTVQALLEPPLMPSSQIPELREEAMKHAQDAVADAMDVLTPTGAKLSQSISVLLKNPKTVILEEAKQWGADLIVLGPHGRSGMERFLIGSVAESVATHAECSVEVVRRK